LAYHLGLHNLLLLLPLLPRFFLIRLSCTLSMWKRLLWSRACVAEMGKLGGYCRCFVCLAVCTCGCGLSRTFYMGCGMKDFMTSYSLLLAIHPCPRLCVCELTLCVLRSKFTLHGKPMFTNQPSHLRSSHFETFSKHDLSLLCRSKK
jgi:hypothetical protein